MADITMPKMGFDMEQGTIVRWLKNVGDKIEKGQAIAEIETDKVTIEIESFSSGTLTKIVAEEGAVVPVGDVIAELDGPSGVGGSAQQWSAAKAPSGDAAPDRTASASRGGEGGEATSDAAKETHRRRRAQTAAPAADPGEAQLHPATASASSLRRWLAVWLARQALRSPRSKARDRAAVSYAAMWNRLPSSHALQQHLPNRPQHRHRQPNQRQPSPQPHQARQAPDDASLCRGYARPSRDGCHRPSARCRTTMSPSRSI